MCSFCSVPAEERILQTLSEESISAMDPNNIERNCSTISFVLPRVRAHPRPHQLESLGSVTNCIDSFIYKIQKNNKLVTIMHETLLILLTI